MTNEVINLKEFKLTQVMTKPETKKSRGRPKKREEDKKKIVKPEKGTLRYERQKEQWKQASKRYYDGLRADREFARAVRKMEKEERVRKEKEKLKGGFTLEIDTNTKDGGFMLSIDTNCEDEKNVKKMSSVRSGSQ